MEKIRRKKFTRSISCSFGSATPAFFFLANIPYFNFQINFQSSHLTKKETEDASKRLSSYCMEAVNCFIYMKMSWKFVYICYICFCVTDFEFAVSISEFEMAKRNNNKKFQIFMKTCIWGFSRILIENPLSHFVNSNWRFHSEIGWFVCFTFAILDPQFLIWKI